MVLLIRTSSIYNMAGAINEEALYRGKRNYVLHQLRKQELPL